MSKLMILGGTRPQAVRPGRTSYCHRESEGKTGRMVIVIHSDRMMFSIIQKVQHLGGGLALRVVFQHVKRRLGDRCWFFMVVFFSRSDSKFYAVKKSWIVQA